MIKIVAKSLEGNNYELSGASTALLRSDSDYYILSCQHVLALTSKTIKRNLKRRIKIRTEIIGSGYGLPVIGERRKDADFPHKNSPKIYALDASLALVNGYESQIKEAHKGKHRIYGSYNILRDSSKLYTGNGFAGRKVKIITPNGKIDGNLIRATPRVELCFKTLRSKIKVAIKLVYSIKTTSGVTKDGDSGSPVLCRISGKNYLIGMHFWGYDKSNLAHCIPAHLLVRKETFGLELEFIA